MTGQNARSYDVEVAWALPDAGTPTPAAAPSGGALRRRPRAHLGMDAQSQRAVRDALLQH